MDKLKADAGRGMSTDGVLASDAPHYWCNKCGYSGPVQAGHKRPFAEGECGYMAVPVPPAVGVMVRYDGLYEYAEMNRLDYNELCRVVRLALGVKGPDTFPRTGPADRAANPVDEPYWLTGPDGAYRNPKHPSIPGVAACGNTPYDEGPFTIAAPTMCEFPVCAVHHICERNCERNAGVALPLKGQPDA